MHCYPGNSVCTVMWGGTVMRGKWVRRAALNVYLSTLGAASNNKSNIKNDTFKLNYAPHFGMFSENAGQDFIDQLQFMYDQGFRSIEDNGMKNRSKSDQNKIAKKMARLGMTMGVFVANNI